MQKKLAFSEPDQTIETTGIHERYPLIWLTDHIHVVSSFIRHTVASGQNPHGQSLVDVAHGPDVGHL